MMFRTSAIVCAVIAGGLLAWAGYLTFVEPSDENRPAQTAHEARARADGGGGLVVENAEQDLGERPLGEHRVVFRVTNRSDRPGEVVGGSNSCAATCCVQVQEQGRVPVPPGGSVELVSLLELHQPGPFEYEGELYLNEGGGLRTLRIKYTGVGIAGGKPHAPQP